MNASSSSSTTTKVKCVLSKVTNPFLNLAIEDWLFQSTSRSQSHILYLWRNSPSVIIGRNQNPWTECDIHQLNKDCVPWIRRKSGGGCVYHDLGNSNYTVIEPRETFTRQKNLHMILTALKESFNVPVELNARHDLVVNNLKISGSAFKLTSTRAYHHGTLLIDANLQTLRTYLKPKSKCLVSNGVPSVPSPVSNLRPYAANLSHASFCDALIDQFAKMHDSPILHSSILEIDDSIVLKEPLVARSYNELLSDDWRLQQTPDFSSVVPVTSDISCHISCQRGTIQSIQFKVHDSVNNACLIAGLAHLEQCMLGTLYYPINVLNAWNKYISGPEVLDWSAESGIGLADLLNPLVLKLSQSL